MSERPTRDESPLPTAVPSTGAPMEELGDEALESVAGGCTIHSETQDPTYSKYGGCGGCGGGIGGVEVRF